MTYSHGFFSNLRSGSFYSAVEIVPILLDLFRPASVLDVGCGDGTWLSVFQRYGITDILGLDGDYVDESTLQIPATNFRRTDLSTDWDVGKLYDLTISLEVAEHIPQDRADAFVAGLTRSALIVVMSAAIPYQGGTRHVNEQWPAYWAEKFDALDYAAIDCIRPRIWTNPRVKFWYAQNTVTYIWKQLLPEFERVRSGVDKQSGYPIGLVHPELWNDRYNPARLLQADSLRLLLEGVRSSTRSFVERNLGRKSMRRQDVPRRRDLAGS